MLESSASSRRLLLTYAGATCMVGAVVLGRLLALRRKLREVDERRSALALELMATRNRLMHSPESVAKGRAFAPRKDDIFVVTYPKCGTTWVTQICQVLRTHGRADLNAFGEITEVVPWDILALDCGQNLDMEQISTPRIFKSHESFGNIPKGAKYIYVARNPCDAFVSFFKFLPPYMGLKSDDIAMENFSSAIFAGVSHSGQIWHHFRDWYTGGLKDPNVLWVFYEDLISDLAKEVRRIAAFMGIQSEELEGKDGLLAVTLEQSSYRYMQKHASQFDDHFVFEATKERMGRHPADKFTVGKVRKGGGKVGSRALIPPAVRLLLDRKWNEIIFPAIGCGNYDEFCEKVRRERAN